MARVLMLLVTTVALALSGCARIKSYAEQPSDIDKIWVALKSGGHGASLSLRGDTVDIKHIHSFVVAKPSLSRSIGFLSGDLSGRILLFDRAGMLLASHETGSIRNFQLPDPGILSEENDGLVAPIDRLFLTEGSLVGSGPKIFSLHLYRIGPSSIRELWKVESYVEADNAEHAIEYKTASVVDDTGHEADNRQFLLIESDLLKGSVMARHCLIAPDDSVTCKMPLTPPEKP